jgi:AcrR family transcriptional regulator
MITQGEEMAQSAGRHAERREQSIERLQQAAVELLAGKNYANIRIEDIAGRAGMAKGSMYMYFKGKDELYLQVFDRYFTEMFAEEFERFVTADDPREALRGLIEFAVNQTSPSNEIMFIYRAVLDPSLSKLIKPRTDEYIARYYGVVEGLFKRLGCGEVKERGYLLAVLLDGLWFYRIMEMEPQELVKSQKKRDALKETIYKLFDL